MIAPGPSWGVYWRRNSFSKTGIRKASVLPLCLTVWKECEKWIH
jgi:hypothetical protein